MKTKLFPFAVLAMIVLPIQAAPRASANYSIAEEAAVGGGRKTASASYSNDGSIGDIAGMGTVTSPAQIVRHGYIGQLYDVTGVGLSASPPSVNEGGTRELSANAVLDDATFVLLTPNQVSWSIVTGPISSINSGGLATAAKVYQNTPATVQGGYLGKFGTLSLTVLNVGNDDFGLYAGDGLPDDWQVLYFGENNPKAAPGLDPDGDGQNNAYEYIAGTVPTNAASRFQFTINDPTGQPTQKLLTLSPRFPDRTYTVQFRTNFGSGSFTDLTTTTQSDNGTTRTVSDTNAVPANKFYRVGISFP